MSIKFLLYYVSSIFYLILFKSKKSYIKYRISITLIYYMNFITIYLRISFPNSHNIRYKIAMI